MNIKKTTTLELNFNNTQIAFAHKTNGELKKAHLLFSSFKYPIFVNYGPKLATWALSIYLPIKGLVKNTIFAQFCGGENIVECTRTIAELNKSNIGTILDYSVEGEEKEEVFDVTCQEILDTIQKAKDNKAIPFSVFKTTGIARFNLLVKINANKELNEIEKREYDKVKHRFDTICKAAFDAQVRLFVDAEETWIQDAIENLTYEMMLKYNQKDAIVYNTIQCYRTDMVAHVNEKIANLDCKVGFKLVRGAYMEKERLRAKEMIYVSPIHPSKEDTDKEYNEVLEICVKNAHKVSICAGTHNEQSSHLLAKLMAENKIPHTDTRFYFAQLLGMSDHISYNLANAGYCVAKYVPYGPVKAVLPYLGRRAKENSSVKGQVGRELNLISEELKRRKS